jgi:hypothetical protein
VVNRGGKALDKDEADVLPDMASADWPWRAASAARRKGRERERLRQIFNGTGARPMATGRGNRRSVDYGGGR